ncbi:MAG TPA: TIGR04282 family arsenosugar biosynthesis glycosyltransferase [Thermoanaerobaculia bacterium]|nr:TIGR04282 family arsenosugar biosynthesis glycosyltransferase [Thermoanaerobaculia bacterium]
MQRRTDGAEPVAEVKFGPLMRRILRAMLELATRRPPASRLLVFTRVPELGRVKSRLAHLLGEEKALRLHEAMIADLLAAIGESTDTLEIEILWTGSREVTGSTLRRYFDSRPVAMQTGSTLGDRLAVAFSERIFFHATDKVLAIGTDDPTLTRETVELAFDLLDSCDWVLGPATDGGYYLIGCRGASYHSSVFRDIEWGTAGVFRATRERIRALGATLAILPSHTDIDEVDDLRTLSSTISGGSGRVTDVLRTWGWIE